MIYSMCSINCWTVNMENNSNKLFLVHKSYLFVLKFNVHLWFKSSLDLIA